MERYILMECEEREIFILGTFNSLLKAKNAMKKRMIEVLAIRLDTVKEAMCYRYDYWDIDGDKAWSNLDGDCNFDWAIEKIIV